MYSQDDFKELRACIYTSVDEFMRFRQLVVNVVLATDIFDKELSQLRKNRWTKAFTDYNFQESEEDYINRKATIVIEHLIQASDVSHTMQHWDIYRKWVSRLSRRRAGKNGFVNYSHPFSFPLILQEPKTIL